MFHVVSQNVVVETIALAAGLRRILRALIAGLAARTGARGEAGLEVAVIRGPVRVFGRERRSLVLDREVVPGIPVDTLTFAATPPAG